VANRRVKKGEPIPSVRQRAIFVVGDFAKEDALVGPQQIARRKDHAGCGPRRPLPVDLVGAQQNQVFADESIEHWQAE